ncbi:MAG: hypothetical protein JSS07_04165 [Proteobacteria bacterium]|nr:hypothetical protein [Pseudomonadota bacterium]
MRYSKIVFTTIFALFSLPIYAVIDCQTILAKLPEHSPDSSELAKMVDNFEKECAKRPDANNPDVYNQCVTVGMRSMAVSGNFIAAEKIAKMECEAGNDTISKTWMGLVLGNNNASDADKQVAQEAIDNKEQQ